MDKLVLRLKAMLQRLKNNEGVTLIELLAVVVILAIIAAVGVPIVINQINTAKTKTDKANEQIIADALNRAEFDWQTSNSGYLYITPGSAGSTGSGTGTITQSSGTGVASYATSTPTTTGSVYNLLVTGDGSGSYLQAVPTPQTSTNYTITPTLTDSSKPYVQFTFPDSSTGGSGQFYITTSP